jgi:hypothetical protein
VQVAEERHEAPVAGARQEHVGPRRLRDRILRLDRVAVLVAGAEVLAVEREVRRVLAGEHGVRLGAGGDEDRLGRKPGLAGFVPLPVLAEPLPREADPLRRAVLVDVHRERGEALGEHDPFLERLLDFLVVERVRGAVDQPPAVGDRHAAPALQELGDPRRQRLERRLRPLATDRPGMGQELLGDLTPSGFHLSRRVGPRSAAAPSYFEKPHLDE